ncbi:hypothetical protein FB192DRAFT_1406640 [Mucor lusitanicus]|uniref:Uncharacterized protein n=1 Tax=Mucor circinelloides f. lusitanicus TaxID=29924 RepID=A0A8H4B5T4_MUCCL|nr:hypothetical protein FB192DRAFT_1406640 [Mucor lusitanicus]
MDLSWCIMCDKRIMDDSESLSKTADSLYCSEDCKLKDTSSKLTWETSARPVVHKKSLKRAAPSSTHYPWIPCYNKRRHNYYLATNQIKRCSSPAAAAQPTAVAGSAASAAAVGSGILSLIH